MLRIAEEGNAVFNNPLSISLVAAFCNRYLVLYLDDNTDIPKHGYRKI
jgi:hypothetical protein